MIRFMLVMVPLVFLINGLTKHDWHEAFFFSLAVAVGLTPEMLPMIVSVCLSKGAMAMSRKKVIVKRLNSIQNFGAMDVLCTDKTGTLTMDHVILEIYCDVFKSENEEVLRDAYLISHFQTGLKNVLDRAVLQHQELHEELSLDQYSKVDEIPFDFSRRMMSVAVEGPDGQRQLLTKGAPEAVFARCTHFESDGEIFPMEPILVGDLIEQVNDLSEDGFRVLAIATKKVEKQAAYSKADERELVLTGYLAFLDPPKDTAATAITALRQHGITVKVLTGDNDLVTRKVCNEVGIKAEKIVLGSQVETMTDAQLAEAVETTDVFARLSPAHKQRIVQALQHKGHVVGFMGDGINDAPALRAADVGISVDTAVDIAKESADVILLEKSLHGAGGRRAGGAQGLRQHPQVHPHGRQLQLRQHVQRDRRQRLAALRAHGPHPDPHQQPALRLLPGADPHRQRRPAADRQAPALEHGRDRQVHPLHRPHQLDLRLHHLLRDVVRLQVQRRGHHP